MTFTSTPPTTPGFYAWMAYQGAPITVGEVISFAPGCLRFRISEEINYVIKRADEMGGQWCRLVPADEIPKTWNESREQDYWPGKLKWSWEESRAKRVMDGNADNPVTPLDPQSPYEGQV